MLEAQPIEDLAPLFALEVEGHAALVAMQILKVVTVSSSRRYVVFGSRRFDAKHVGSPVTELSHSRRAGARDSQVKDSNFLERQRILGHGLKDTLRP